MILIAGARHDRARGVGLAGGRQAARRRALSRGRPLRHQQRRLCTRRGPGRLALPHRPLDRRGGRVLQPAGDRRAAARTPGDRAGALDQAAGDGGRRRTAGDGCVRDGARPSQERALAGRACVQRAQPLGHRAGVAAARARRRRARPRAALRPHPGRRRRRRRGADAGQGGPRRRARRRDHRADERHAPRRRGRRHAERREDPGDRRRPRGGAGAEPGAPAVPHRQRARPGRASTR